MTDKSIDKITKYLGLLAGGAAVFYMLGFIVINTFTHEIKLPGISWLTDDLYRDSGASFILDMVRVPLFTPHLFFPWLVALYFLALPREKELLSFKTHLSTREPGEIPDKWWARLIFNLKRWGARLILYLSRWRTFFILYFFLTLTFLFAIFYGRLLVYYFYLLDNPLTFYLKGVIDPAREGSLIFFSFVTPMIIVFGVFMNRFRNTLKGDVADNRIYRRFFQASGFLYLAFLLTVPISYGINIYDWSLAHVKNPKAIRYILTEETGERHLETTLSSANVWFIGDFDGKYLFLTKKNAAARGVIAVIDEDNLKHLDFFAEVTGSLRDQMSGSHILVNEEVELPNEPKDVGQFLGFE